MCVRIIVSPSKYFHPQEFRKSNIFQLVSCTAVDHRDSNGIVYIIGPSPSMSLADMDVVCNGIDNYTGAGWNDLSGQNVTAFKYSVSKHSTSALSPNNHTYVVLGNAGQWMPNVDAGIEPLSVVAVVCNDQLVRSLLSFALEGSSYANTNPVSI